MPLLPMTRITADNNESAAKKRILGMALWALASPGVSVFGMLDPRFCWRRGDLLTVCRDTAELRRETWGVWGGKDSAADQEPASSMRGGRGRNYFETYQNMSCGRERHGVSR